MTVYEMMKGLTWEREMLDGTLIRPPSSIYNKIIIFY
jgi:hypothetical protein